MRITSVLIGVVAVLSWQGSLPEKALAQPVPSVWQGQIEGTAAGRSFRLPVTLELSRALPQEANPFHFAIMVEDVSVVGSVMLTSALRMQNGLTLQYLQIRRSGAVYQADLVNDQSSVAAVINQFVAPNLSAQTAPPIMQEIYRGLGSVEMYAFRRGAQVRWRFEGNRVVGELAGQGRGYVNIFPADDAVYRARFVAQRVR